MAIHTCGEVRTFCRGCKDGRSADVSVNVIQTGCEDKTGKQTQRGHRKTCDVHDLDDCFSDTLVSLH